MIKNLSNFLNNINEVLLNLEDNKFTKVGVINLMSFLKSKGLLNDEVLNKFIQLPQELNLRRSDDLLYL